MMYIFFPELEDREQNESNTYRFVPGVVREQDKVFPCSVRVVPSQRSAQNVSSFYPYFPTQEHRKRIYITSHVVKNVSSSS